MRFLFILLFYLCTLAGCSALPANFEHKTPIYNKVIIEIASIQGSEPDPEALAFFKSKLLDYRITKIVEIRQEVYQIDRNSLIFPFANIWGHASLVTYENLYRKLPVSKDPRQFNLFVAYLHGDFIEGKLHGLAGIQYKEASFAVFKSSTTKVEGQVLLHEMGHILLIADDSHSPDRKPPNSERPNHCANPKCVMFWQTSEEAADFDETCRLELLNLLEIRN